jgi:hypothetical protein
MRYTHIVTFVLVFEHLSGDMPKLISPTFNTLADIPIMSVELERGRIIFALYILISRVSSSHHAASIYVSCSLIYTNFKLNVKSKGPE